MGSIQSPGAHGQNGGLRCSVGSGREGRGGIAVCCRWERGGGRGTRAGKPTGVQGKTLESGNPILWVSCRFLGELRKGKEEGSPLSRSPCTVDHHMLTGIRQGRVLADGFYQPAQSTRQSSLGCIEQMGVFLVTLVGLSIFFRGVQTSGQVLCSSRVLQSKVGSWRADCWCQAKAGVTHPTALYDPWQ